MKYKKLEFIELTEPKIRSNGRKRKRGLFKCDCGNINDYDYSAVITGHIKNCNKCGIKLRSKAITKHGFSKNVLYRRWADMKKRCYNPNVQRYNQYGALGIKVCDEWKNSFECFLKWSIENGYSKELSLERKNVNGNYEPSNCIYIPLREQHFNKKNTRYILYKGEEIALSKLLHKENLSHHLSNIHSRLNRGQDINDILKHYKSQ